MAPRAIWKGRLQISLVTIPIKVFPATESSESLSFHQLHSACQSRIQQKKWCPICAREVPSAEIVKGFEFEQGKYVLLLPEELEAVQPVSTKVIDLTSFAAATHLDLRAIDRAYYLVPDGPAESPAADAYALMVAALVDAVGFGKLAIYGREYLVAVGSTDQVLRLYTLHHAAELRPAPAIPIHNTRNPVLQGHAAVKLATQIVAALTSPRPLAAFTDQYQADLRRLIDAKIAGHEIVEPVPVDPVPVVNLREALEQSLAAVSAQKKIPAKVSLETTPKRTRA